MLDWTYFEHQLAWRCIILPKDQIRRTATEIQYLPSGLDQSKYSAAKPHRCPNSQFGMIHPNCADLVEWYTGSRNFASSSLFAARFAFLTDPPACEYAQEVRHPKNYVLRERNQLDCLLRNGCHEIRNSSMATLGCSAASGTGRSGRRSVFDEGLVFPGLSALSWRSFRGDGSGRIVAL